MPVISVRGLKVKFGSTQILRGVDFDLEAGQTLGVVGESGCGKSMTGLTLMGMVPHPGHVEGSIRLEGRELLGLPEREWRNLRGDQIAMVMQDPFSSLNPVMRVGDQIAEVYQVHSAMSYRQAHAKAVEMIGHVGIPDPERSARKFPHEMSGGQRQRIVIGCAFAGRPKALIADEPTTALDVTIQAQILELLGQLQAECKTAVMLISHDIGVIGEVAHRMAVFYAGKIVETGPTERVLRSPQHPYTRALLAALPSPEKDTLESIPGQPPRFEELESGCSFAPRCPFRFEKCQVEPELMVAEPEHSKACWLDSQN
ncbi:MAG: ABC transporter ATP-binding protein [Armatimonadetes bacterium]|nr:ABC transporter ATP-binding protein [Armatimonadota bacterium]